MCGKGVVQWSNFLYFCIFVFSKKWLFFPNTIVHIEWRAVVQYDVITVFVNKTTQLLSQMSQMSQMIMQMRVMTMKETMMMIMITVAMHFCVEQKFTQKSVETRNCSFRNMRTRMQIVTSSHFSVATSVTDCKIARMGTVAVMRIISLRIVTMKHHHWWRL